MARIFVATIFTFVVLFAELPKTLTVAFEIGNYLCKKALITESVNLIDEHKNLLCVGTVEHEICAGHCLSSERHTKHFSTEKNHPVCMYAGEQNASRYIHPKNCPISLNRDQLRMSFIEPIKCVCSECDSSYASCEFPTKRTMNPLARFQPSFRRIYVPKPVAESEEKEEWAFESPPSAYLI